MGSLGDGLQVCASIGPVDVAAFVRRARSAASRGADLVELRLDRMVRWNLEAFKASVPEVRTIVASPGAGGPGSGEATARLLESIPYADAVDLGSELPSAVTRRYRRLAEDDGSATIISAHREVAPDSKEIRRYLQEKDGDIRKLAVRVRTARDVRRLFKAVSGLKRPFCLMGMGPLGGLTRAWAASMGASLVYAAESPTEPTAAGQLDLETQLLLRGRAPGPSTPFIGIIGHPLGHSLSPRIHNAALPQLGLDWFSIPFDTPPEELGETVAALRELGIRGFNVTNPHKRSIIPLLARVDDDASRVGAVNTVTAMEEGLVGTNTDVAGFAALLKTARDPDKGAKVVVLGAGGAARAAVVAMDGRAASITVLARRAEAAVQLVHDLGRTARAAGYAELVPALVSADLLVNATPVGTVPEPGASPVPAELLRKDLAVVDMVYNPDPTRLVSDALAVGAAAVGGLELFVGQGVLALERMTGKRPDLEIVRAAAMSALHPDPVARDVEADLFEAVSP